MSKYEHGKIYKIISSQSDKMYIGSTVSKYLCERMGQHKYAFVHKNVKKCRANEIVQYDDAKIVLIENYPCKSRDELLQREQFWIDQHQNDCLNAHKAWKGPMSTQDYHKQKYERKKSEISLKSKERYAKNCEAIKQKAKEYRAQNQEKIQAKKLERITCDCGIEILKSNISTHKKTKNHQEIMKNK